MWMAYENSVAVQNTRKTGIVTPVAQCNRRDARPRGQFVLLKPHDKFARKRRFVSIQTSVSLRPP